MDGLAITINLGDGVPGWLPLMPTRFALEAAYRRALGWMPDDTDKATGAPNESDFGAVLAAYVAACWGGEPLQLNRHTEAGPVVVTVPPGPAAVRAFNRDCLAFGESAIDALFSAGYETGAVFEAGAAVRSLVLASIPTQSEVEESAGNSAGAADTSTAPMSKSA